MWIEIHAGSSSKSGHKVTPLAGVWIEITLRGNFASGSAVTPLAGVWIEIVPAEKMLDSGLSLPLRECGLKY